jgi:hypothetical protein
MFVPGVQNTRLEKKNAFRKYVCIPLEYQAGFRMI